MHVLQRKVIQEMQKENLQKRRLARKEWLQFTVEIESNNSCTNEIQRTIYAHFLDLFQCYNWYSPLLSGYCCRKCLYTAVVVFFIMCRDLICTSLPDYRRTSSPRWAAERICAYQVLSHVEKPYHFS